MTLQFIIMLIISAILIVAPYEIQKQEYPLSCVAEAGNLKLQAWQRSYLSFDISREYWQTLIGITGDSIWTGYPEGWDVPGDAVGAWKIEGEIDGVTISIWIWHSESSGNYYVFPFENTLLFADGAGQHYGMHPCGGWQVDRKEFILPIIEIINETNE